MTSIIIFLLVLIIILIAKKSGESTGHKNLAKPSVNMSKAKREVKKTLSYDKDLKGILKKSGVPAINKPFLVGRDTAMPKMPDTLLYECDANSAGRLKADVHFIYKMEDRDNDWLARQIKEEQKAAKKLCF